MIHSIIQYLQGYLNLCVEGDSAERFLNLCSYHKIYIWNVTIHDNVYELQIRIKDFRKIRPIARKTHTHVKIKNRFGFPFFIYSHKVRVFFLVGIIFCICLLKECSARIWDVHFSGNQELTAESLMDFLQTISIYPGMRKEKIDCFQVNKVLREQYPEIVWVSTSLDGSILQIKIKENEMRRNNVPSLEDAEGIDLIATCDGVITQIITRKGIPLVHVGDQVKKGDILVSGRLEIKNDSQEIIRYQYEHSDADVFADTIQVYTDKISRKYKQKQYNKKEQRFTIFFRIKSWSIEIGSLRNSFSNVEKESVEYQIQFGENFKLPIYYGYTKAKGYHFIPQNYSKEELKTKLNLNFEQFLQKLEEKGIQITGKSVNIHLYDVFASADGTLYLNQTITQPVETEMMEIERNEPE